MIRNYLFYKKYMKSMTKTAEYMAKANLDRRCIDWVKIYGTLVVLDSKWLFGDFKTKRLIEEKFYRMMDKFTDNAVVTLKSE